MQKKLIALAIAAAFSAPAFADTTVYGVVDAAITNTTSTGVKSRFDVISGGLSTSRFGVKSVQDLDNGMKAIAVLEYALDVANNETVGTSAGTMKARQQMMALAGDFGTVAAGYLQTTGYDFSNKYNPFAGSAVDPFTYANPTSFITTGSRAAHAAAYISPSMGGVTVAVNRSFNAANIGLTGSADTTVAGNVTTANLVSVSFDQGALSVGGVYVGTANDGTTGANSPYEKVTELGVGASYDFGVVKVLGDYLTHKKDANATSLAADSKAAGTNKLINVSVVAPVGPGALVAGYAKNTIDSTTAVDNKSAFTVAYLHNMSKNVTAYGAVEQAKVDVGTTSNTTTVLAVGVRQKF